MGNPRTTPIKAKSVLPHPYPRRSYMTGTGRGSKKPAIERVTVMALTAEADTLVKQSTVYKLIICRPLTMPKANMKTPRLGSIQ